MIPHDYEKTCKSLAASDPLRGVSLLVRPKAPRYAIAVENLNTERLRFRVLFRQMAHDRPRPAPRTNGGICPVPGEHDGSSSTISDELSALAKPGFHVAKPNPGLCLRVNPVQRASAVLQSSQWCVWRVRYSLVVRDRVGGTVRRPARDRELRGRKRLRNAYGSFRKV